MFKLIFAALLALGSAAASAEPYFAVQTGLKCSQCHVNQTGGGMRTQYGNLFAQNQLAAEKLDTGTESWLGNVNQFLGMGANLRTGYTVSDTPKTEATNSFDTREARLYFNFTPIPERLSVYIDQLVAPGSALNREAFVRFNSKDGQAYVKAGRIYLPFGWRLQDNDSFVRTETGISMNGADNGVEFGYDSDQLSTQLAVSNGTLGGAEADKGKQISLQSAYIENEWRLGAAANYNDVAGGARAALGLFAGLRTGPVSWLAEADAIEDRSLIQTLGRKRRSIALLLEANWLIEKGQNLKLTTELLDPDRSVRQDQVSRISAVYEFTPVQYLQLRGGARYFDGPPQRDAQNRRLFFLELNGFF